VITLRGGQAPEQGRRIEDTMPHDKIRAAALKRMAETGEPYAAARRAVVAGYQGGGREATSPDAGYALRMSGEIHDWLAGLRDSDRVAAMAVGQALAALMNEGNRLGEPLVASTASSWPWAVAEGLDRTYQESMVRLTAVRRGEADAATLLEDIRKQTAELESAEARLQDLHRRLLDAGRTQEAAQAAGTLAAAQQQAAEARRLLPEVARARHRLGEEGRRLQAHAGAFLARKEVLKAGYIAAQFSLLAHETTETTGRAVDSGDRRQEDRDAATSAAEARLLRDATAQMEQELGQKAWPRGLMELRAAGPGDASVCILFAVEPPGTALLIAVLDGPEAVRGQYLEAILLSADRLRQWRAGQAPEAAAHGYDNTRRFLEELYPADADDSGTE
jgi:hypothetical protein